MSLSSSDPTQETERPAGPDADSAHLEWHYDTVLAGLVRRGHGLEALCQYLRAGEDFLLERVVALGLPTPHSRPVRRNTHPRAWRGADMLPLIDCWLSAWDVGSIAGAFERSNGGVYALVRRLGLPSRERAQIRRPAARDMDRTRAAREAQSTPALATHLTVSSRTEPTACAARHPAPTAVALPEPQPGLKRIKVITSFDGLPVAVDIRISRNQVAWTPRLELHVASARWAGQHPQAIADDLGIPYRAVVSRLSLMRVPPLPRSHLVRQYDPAIARERMREAGLIVRECRMQPGRLFFGDRFTYIAPMSKRTINYREMQAGYGD